MSTALARRESVSLLGDVLGRDDARRFVAARDAAIKCCSAMTDSFGWVDCAEVPYPASGAGASDGELDAHRNATRCARATWIFENTASLRGAFWAVVTLRAVLQRNPGDLDARNTLRQLQDYLHDEWWAPEITAKTLEYFEVPAAQWQAWAFSAEVPDDITVRTAIATAHVLVVSRYPTSRRSRGRQSDLFDPPHAAGGR